MRGRRFRARLASMRFIAASSASPADDVLYPTAQRLLQHCDAVLRLPGESAGADLDVATAKRLGLPVYHDVAEIPRLATSGLDRLHAPAAVGTATQKRHERVRRRVDPGKEREIFG
jgi:hypothetical protein